MFILHTFDIHILLFLVIDVSCFFFFVSVANTITYASLLTEHIIFWQNKAINIITSNINDT